MPDNALDRVYAMFRYYLMQNLDGVLPFKAFVGRVVSGKYPDVLKEYYDDDLELLKNDLKQVANRVGW